MIDGGERSVAWLSNDPRAVPRARHFAAQAVTSYGGGPGALGRIQLLVTELVTNAILHAHSAIRLSIQRSGTLLRVEVRDDDPSQLEPPHEPEAGATHGRGLWLVSALAETWGVSHDDTGKTVWFEVDGAAPAY